MTGLKTTGKLKKENPTPETPPKEKKKKKNHPHPKTQKRENGVHVKMVRHVTKIITEENLQDLPYWKIKHKKN